ncbi:GNAT family N-acetyltransferase [Paenibacillus mendelii]|uniref:GNAT family N-acetyltransferase n=1 Tax=Paenibacillus mendelii TaxID=206163 RepID=A0ABV6JJQ6_9BACL|nr:GNAT family N-acetyltransferase [Paenibacillus mendelii]MCQ6557672.1 GNAT family N-acetyltransferase [Paenibacillus mendelii]
MISDAYLDQLSYERRKKNWEWVFHHLNPADVIYVAEDQGEIIGFIHGGKSREVEMDYDAELYALYLVIEAQGKGYGRQLYNRLVEQLKNDHYTFMMVWVLEQNPSMAFYEKLGGQFIRSKEIHIGDNLLIEAALGWRELK